MKSRFSDIEIAPEDPILSLAPLFIADNRPFKVNLGIGSYRTAEGKPYLFQSISQAEAKLAAERAPKEYLPIEGDPAYLESISELIIREKIDKERLYAVQSLGGTGALCIIARLFSEGGVSDIAISNPSWPNHELIFKSAGMGIHFYPYYDLKTHSIDFKAMRKFLENLPPGTAVLLQTACHNPTGRDLSPEQWKDLANLFKSKNTLVVLDNAYQGFADSLEKDVLPIQILLQQDIELIIASSCAKNFGLYGERIGVLHCIFNDVKTKKRVATRVKQIIRTLYSTPPIHGARLIAKVLQDPALKKEWEDELGNLRTRVQEMRLILSSGLISQSGKPHFEFLEKGRGFFSLLGIDESEVMRLRAEKGIYMPLNGRINIAGLTPYNSDYVIDSILSL